MKKTAWVLIFAILAGCSGANGLDSPVKTCKAVTQALVGQGQVVWQTEQQTEQKGVQLQVTLEFTLAGQPAGETSQAVCIYRQNGQDQDYRSAMGEYVNTPSQIMVNGMPIPENDLVQAVNLATANAAKAVLNGH